jgi:3-methyladenine DNA glycosylase Tag
MILNHRDAFRDSFHDWLIDEVASINAKRVDQMLQYASIIRNRRKNRGL